MTEPNPKRRLAAIMATDVVGYSKLMQSDEAAALAALGTIREAIRSQIGHHCGRVANTAGDSVLAEFGSAAEAVSCATGLQDTLLKDGAVRHLQVRIGIHLGDVVEKGGDLFGSAVNIAARLEGIAPPGGIVVSGAVRDSIAGKLAASFTDLGLKTLKNIQEPLRAYRLLPATGSMSIGLPRAGEALPLPPKPSIAVLPFENLSGDREQEYFADGIVEEIITALSRFRGLFVIARTSSFAYKGRPIDVKQIGRELGVRYILEGSVRKAGSKVRITGQLIDTSTGAHLWADRFGGALEDIFDLQDQVTASVVGAITPKLEQAEIERTRSKPTENLDAYDHYLRGLAGVHQWTKESTEDALSNFYRAIELDSNFAGAYGMAARTYALRKGGGWLEQENEAEAARLARRAVELGKDDAVALGTAGMALSFVVGDHEHGKALTDQAIALNPNFAWAWLFSGWVRLWLGEPDEVINRVARAMRLNPTDPHSQTMYHAIAIAHFFAGRYSEAASWAEMAMREKPSFVRPFCVAAASYALAGRSDDAERTMARVQILDPFLNLSNIQVLFPIKRPEDFARWKEGLRLAGLRQ
jgi:TolB-like protein/class 3 adenylate cyclase/tetratricopeptide (TPR) repeat protein